MMKAAPAMHFCQAVSDLSDPLSGHFPISSGSTLQP